MKKCVVLFFNVLFLFAVYAQNPNLTVSSLEGTNVDSILKHHLEGNGVLFSNGKFNNQAGNVTYPQIGTFNRNDFIDFPFASGLVLTTGDVSVAAGPNNSLSASSSIGSSYYTESDLLPYSGGSYLTSCASLEFDFVAMADTFAVNYIFASEEYCEYVGSSFVDPFAFLLTGFDPVTVMMSTKNVSIIPGSITASNPNGIPVSINNVNHGFHSGGNAPGSNPSNSEYFICNASNSDGVQYDGYTVALSAGAPIFGCQTYHIKMAVCNFADLVYDSGIFLEEGSFHSSGIELESSWEGGLGGDTLVQGSYEQVKLAFRLESPAITSSASIAINTEGDAVLGVDYALIKPNGDLITLVDNNFFFQPGDTLEEVQVVMLPTIGFDDSSQVKEARLIVITQACDGFPELIESSQKYDTVLVYFRLGDPEPEPDTTGIALRDLDTQWIVYPNPAGDYVTVDLKEFSEEVRDITLVDISGKILRVIKPTDNPMRIELTGFPSGTYGILVKTQKGHTTRFFVKK